MADWFKCHHCKRVQSTEEAEPGRDDLCSSCAARPVEEPARPSRRPPDSKNAQRVREHRERTGNAYGKAYEAARRAAVKRLVELHPEDWRRLLDEERAGVGLAPTSG